MIKSSWERKFCPNSKFPDKSSAGLARFDCSYYRNLTVTLFFDSIESQPIRLFYNSIWILFDNKIAKLIVFPLTIIFCFFALLTVWSIEKCLRKLADIYFGKRTRSLSDSLKPNEPMVKMSMVNKNFTITFHEQEEDHDEPDDEGHISKLKF